MSAAARGGKRMGAGRPETDDPKSVVQTVRWTQSEWSRLELGATLAEETASSYVRSATKNRMQREEWMMTAVQHDEASEMVVQMLRVAYRDMPRDKFLEMTERMIQQLEKIAAASSRDERMRLIKNLNF